MSSRLSDRVAQAMEAHTAGGRCDIASASAALREMFEPEDVERAKAEMATRLINKAARSATAEIAGGAPGQGELPFRLHRAYAVDLDEERAVVNTVDLTRMQANRALQIRDLQIEADKQSRNDLERAIKAADPYWDRNPGLSFGEALTLAARDSIAA